MSVTCTLGGESGFKGVVSDGTEVMLNDSRTRMSEIFGRSDPGLLGGYDGM